MREQIETVLKAILNIGGTKVGDVPKWIHEQMKGVKKRKKQMEKEIERRAEELAAQLESEFKDQAEQIKEEQNSLWDEVYAHFGIEGEDKEKLYNINGKGELSVLEEIEKSEHPIQ